MQLEWYPQEAYAEYFYTDATEIIQNRSVFRSDIEYFVARGGRGSAKTWTFADAVVIEASLRPVNVLVTRELQESIDDSIKAEIESAIEKRGLDHFFQITNTYIKGANGSKFIFKGLKNNIKKLKSIANVDIVLCEESEDITKHSWDKLLPSIRPIDQSAREGKPIIIVIFNTGDELDDTYQRFVVSPPPGTITKLINYNQNKYFPAHLDRQRLHFKKTRPEKDYNHEWLGAPRSASEDVIIDGDWIDAARYASRHPLFKRGGERVVAYDPAGQGKDFNAAAFADGNIIADIDEWLRSDDLREASHRGFAMAVNHRATKFKYDTCGGLGDGVSVFVNDRKAELTHVGKPIDISPFNAGAPVAWPNLKIPGTDKTWGEQYVNAKAQGWGIAANRFYSTYRMVRLGDTDMSADDLISLDIEDDQIFNKLKRELSVPLWVKSKVNSRKKVEDKQDTEKRTGQPSGNMADDVIMCYAPDQQTSELMIF